MIGYALANSIDSFAECQKQGKPWPIEDINDYDATQITSVGWHWWDAIPEGYTEVEHWQLLDHLAGNEGWQDSECASCERVTFRDKRGTLYGQDDEQLLFLAALEWDEQLYVILVDGEGLTFITKDKNGG